MAQFDFTKLRAFDVETFGKGKLYGLQPWRIMSRELRIRSYAFSYLHDNKMARIPVGEESVAGVNRHQLSQYLMACAERGDYIVVWNGAYDIACLLALGLEAEVLANKWIDGMLLWIRTEPRRNTYSLKDYIKENLPSLHGYADEIDHEVETPIKELLAYNCGDTDATLYAAIACIQKLTEKELRAAMIEMADLPDVAAANLRGIMLDFNATKELYAYLTKQEADAIAALTPHLPPGRYFATKKDDKNPNKINVKSPKDLPALLYDTWHLPVLKTTPKGGRSTDKETLLELALQDPRAKQIIEIRQAQNRMGKYVQSAIESAKYHDNFNGYQDMYGLGWMKCFITRPQCKKAATYTGRCTYGSKIKKKGSKEIKIGIALHQMKRESIFRKAIIAPPGFLIVEHDFSGQEMRWMAEESEDPTMMQLFLDNMDGHAYMGARISGLSYERIVSDMKKGDEDQEFQNTPEFKESKQARYLGKFANLSLQYRTSAKKLRIKALADYGMVITFEQAQHYRDTYLQTFPGVPAYWDRQIELAQRQGYVETKGGRRVYFKPEDWAGNAWSSESTALNFPIQGVGGDQKALAMMFLTAYYRKNGGMFAWDLHDGLFSYFPEETANYHGKEVQKILSNLPYEQAWGYKPKLPYPVDASIGKSWGEMKGLE